jgi:adenylate cyclase class 2
MPIEIEKKYRLTEPERVAVLARLSALGVERSRVDFEENSIFVNENLKLGDAVVRIRKVDGNAILTFKKRLPSTSGIKHQIELETSITNQSAMEAILNELGLALSLIYEKRREVWHYQGVEIVVDELPFGWFLEIEGPENLIKRVEQDLELKDLVIEHATYPALTRLHGVMNGEVIEARFRAPTIT